MSLDRGSMPNFDARKFCFGVVAARFNKELTQALLDDVMSTLCCAGVAPVNIKIVRVPGSGELPHVASLMAGSGLYDAVIALGVVVAGETPHHLIIGNSTALTLQSIAVETGIPVVNGVIVTETREQAENRTIGSIKRGVEFAEVALEMAWQTEELLMEYSEKD